MKVCMIYYSGFDPLLKRDVDAHIDRGDEVDVICYGKDNQGSERYGRKGQIHRLFTREYNEKHPLQYLLKIGYFFILASKKVFTLHIRKRFDLVHVVSPPDFMAFAALLPKILGAKVILNIHDIVPEFYMRKFGASDKWLVIKALQLIEKICCRLCDHVFTVTEIWRRRLISRRSVLESKCSVLMNVADDRLVNLAKEKNVKSSSGFKLLYPGNLGEHFGVETLIRAIALAKMAISSIRLDVYGDGLQRTFLKYLTESLGVEDKVSFNGYIPIGLLFEKMRECNVGVVPTLDGVFAGEALSGKSLEFIALETPIIISRTAASEYYYNDSMVRFFRPGDHEDLARCIIELYNNPTKREELIKNAKTFNNVHNWQRYREIYSSTVDSLFKNQEKGSKKEGARRKAASNNGLREKWSMPK